MEEKDNTQNSVQNNPVKKQSRINSFIICIILLTASPAVIAAAVMLLTDFSITVLLRCTVTLVVLSGLLSVAVYRAVKERELLFDNRENLIRFVSAFICCTVLSGLSAILPEFTVPIASLALIAAFLSNVYCGLICALIFGAMPFLIVEKSFEFFLFETAVSMIIIILVLAGRHERKKAAEPIMVFTFAYIVLYTALIILKRLDLVPSAIINPAVGLILNDIIILLAIKLVARNIIFAYEERYQGIVDPEYPLLVELKQKNRTEYKRAIHTAYICDRLSDKLGFDRILLKGAGFYHRIGVLSKDHDDVSLATVYLLRHEGFPEPLIRLLGEYGNERMQTISPEASLICIADSVISEILKRMEKGEEDINYERLIDGEINKLIGSRNGRLQKSDLRIQHLYKIRKYLKEEKLYYDFLR